MRRENYDSIQKSIAASLPLRDSLIEGIEKQIQHHKNNIQHLESDDFKKHRYSARPEQILALIKKQKEQIASLQEVIVNLRKFESITQKQQFRKRIQSSLDRSTRSEKSFKSFLSEDLLVYGLKQELALYFCHNLWNFSPNP